MHKIMTSLILAVIFANVVNAGDNSQATLGDIKEAVYKLIVQNKTGDKRASKFESTLSNFKVASDQMIGERDKDYLDLHIERFVNRNAGLLNTIDKSRG